MADILLNPMISIQTVSADTDILIAMLQLQKVNGFLKIKPCLCKPQLDGDKRQETK